MIYSVMVDKDWEKRLRELIEEVVDGFVKEFEDIDKEEVVGAVFERIFNSIGKNRELVRRLVEEELNRRRDTFQRKRHKSNRLGVK